MESDAVGMESDPISRLLTQYPTLTLTDDGTHVRCTLTGHEMPLKPEIVQAYAGSKRYARLLGWVTSPYYEKYKQFLVDCSSKKRNRNQVYCTLTKHFINRTHWHLMRHVQGVKFREAYNRWMQNPWPLSGDMTSQTTQQRGAKTSEEVGAKKQAATHGGGESDGMKAAAAGKSEAADDDDDDDDDDADIDDIINQTHHQKADVDDAKEIDDADDDSCSDLYPENDFNEMDSGETSQQGESESKNPLKRHMKQKKPAALKDLKTKMQRIDDDNNDDD